jgi:hypothetical protein
VSAGFFDMPALQAFERLIYWLEIEAVNDDHIHLAFRASGSGSLLLWHSRMSLSRAAPKIIKSRLRHIIALDAPGGAGAILS